MSDEENKKNVSYFMLEGILTHFTLIIKRLILTIVFITVLWAATIAGFLWYISLPVEELSTVEVESDGGYANYVGNDVKGGIYNGENNN